MKYADSELSEIFLKAMGEQSIMDGRKPQKPETKEENPEDMFINLVQKSMEAALKLTNMEPKDKNALFANCIKFIAVKNKLKGEEGSFFDD